MQSSTEPSILTLFFLGISTGGHDEMDLDGVNDPADLRGLQTQRLLNTQDCWLILIQD